MCLYLQSPLVSCQCSHQNWRWVHRICSPNVCKSPVCHACSSIVLLFPFYKTELKYSLLMEEFICKDSWYKYMLIYFNFWRMTKVFNPHLFANCSVCSIIFFPYPLPRKSFLTTTELRIYYGNRKKKFKPFALKWIIYLWIFFCISEIVLLWDHYINENAGLHLCCFIEEVNDTDTCINKLLSFLFHQNTEFMSTKSLLW